MNHQRMDVLEMLQTWKKTFYHELSERLTQSCLTCPVWAGKTAISLSLNRFDSQELASTARINLTRNGSHPSHLIHNPFW